MSRFFCSARSLLILLLVLPLILTSCERSRPPGYIQLGKVVELLAPEQNLPQADIFLRLDSRGYSAMSTVSTHDLSELTLKLTPEGERWVSEFDTSTFLKDGTVAKGPATRDLPYYELVLKQGEYDGPVDSLYVIIGSEKPKEWRLRVP